MKISPKWPILLDPDNQTVHWVRKVQKENGLVSIDVEDEDLVKDVINAVDNGFPFLIENIRDTIDSSLDRFIT